MAAIKRGAFIVLEGCDRSGKTTQCRKLVESLKSKQILAETMSFPDRTTTTGKLITEYLINKTELSDKTIHLLFSANRWELAKKMERMLNDGITLIVDRYAYSGVVFSAAKPNMDFEWCKQSDEGLPRPDLVFLLTLSPQAIENRPGYGNERYEQPELQKRVAEMFMKLKDDGYWQVVNADDSINNVHNTLLDKILTAIDNVKNKPLEKLW